MFGYVLINKPEMKFKDFDKYRTYYCGLCKTIKNNYGFFSRLCVNYDLTFLAILLSGLYEPMSECNCRRCIVHPFKRQRYFNNKYIEYAADMNVYLAYLKCIDDWNDEKRKKAYIYSKIIRKKALMIEDKYPQKTEIIKEKMKELSLFEREDNDDLDKVSGSFGTIMREIFIVNDDVFSEALSNMGFFLGKFIYILDAYEDLDRDKEKNCYNPLRCYENKDNYNETIQKILVSMMAECCKSFEYLPIIENIEILRNILYSGVWTKYNLVKTKKKENN